MRPDPSVPFNFLCATPAPGAPSPFVRDGVVMPLRDSCTSALSPALLSQARGSISSRTQAAGVSAATRIIMSLYRGLRRLSPRPLVGFGWRRGLRRVRGPSPNCSGCQNCRWLRLATRWISPSPIADGWASSSTATARREVLPQTLVDRRRQLGQQRHFGVGKFERHGSLRMARRTIDRS